MLHHELSATLLHSRVRTVDVAARNARVSGLEGLRYPWESALTGWPTFGNISIHEINVLMKLNICEASELIP